MAQRADEAAPWRPAVALGLALTGATASLVAAGLLFIGARRGVPILTPSLGDIAVGLAFPLAGALIVFRRPDNATGWVLVSAALIGVSALAHVWVHEIVAGGQSLPGLEVAAWVASWAFTPYFLLPVLLPLLFPLGKLPPGRWGLIVKVHVTLVALATVAAAFRTDPDVEDLGVANPLGLVPDPWNAINIVVLMGTALGSFFVLGPAALLWFFLRFRESRGTERAQRAWLLLGFSAALAAVVLGGFFSEEIIADLIWVAGFTAIPVTIMIAVVRHQLLDIEMVVNRTIAYAALTILGLAAYFGAVAIAGSWARDSVVAPFAAAAIALVAASGRTKMQRLVERRLFGAATDPSLVMDRVGLDIAAAADPGEALLRLVRSLRGTLRVPMVAVEVAVEGPDDAVVGDPTASVEEFPITSGGRLLGTLRVGRRRHGEPFRPTELLALRDVARRAATILEAAVLATDLRRSRDDLVIAREEERRRVRRDLHDGLGPALAGMALQLDTLVTRLDGDDDLKNRASQLRTRVAEAVREVRRIIDGLRPAVVDELGLTEALRQLGSSDASGIQITLDAPESLPALPAAVEVAAYRIVSEAVTNAIRHANGETCSISIRFEDPHLILTVSDDGLGFGTDVVSGVGLRSIHDRATEVGGSSEVVSELGSGTVVRARLPVGTA